MALRDTNNEAGSTSIRGEKVITVSMTTGEHQIPEQK